MARVPRIVIPGLPHHITHRSNEKKFIFRHEDEFVKYKSLLMKYSRLYNVKIIAYCIMSNHPHIIAVPGEADSFARCIKFTHHSYALWYNKKNSREGHLWQERYYSCPLDDEHFLHAVRYVETNPVRARIANYAEEYMWSSARAHVFHTQDELLDSEFNYQECFPDWGVWLASGQEMAICEHLRDKTKTGRPCGSDSFIGDLELQLGRKLRKQRRGPKPKKKIQPALL